MRQAFKKSFPKIILQLDNLSFDIQVESVVNVRLFDTKTPDTVLAIASSILGADGMYHLYVSETTVATATMTTSSVGPAFMGFEKIHI